MQQVLEIVFKTLGCVLALALSVSLLLGLIIILKVLLQIPEGIEAFDLKGRPGGKYYIDTRNPQKVDLAKAGEGSVPIYQNYLKEILGSNPTVYFFGISVRGLGRANRIGEIHVVTQEGLERARRGESVDLPRRENLYVLKEALREIV